ncbi:uncharacterized protein I206_100972 [Kwoniella pini CBS 10737]|uniref:NAD-dependent epimerase/dehydratase domain-containing protein n=1 Tax=Kwoniella pini CBS 10737 TaxID=1296096 RepID=A0A1B9IC63_9TREE|nr:uncharacterized protein I206_00354 [Kwoniella pini CBS 10737]OCF53053.1 hypothetical protein I206_00354 [Kwoniella pini CBS 10737]
MSVPKILVVGGNGFLGSAICKAAVGKGWEVSSMSSSGKPYKTLKGHTPSWVEKVNWKKGNAFEPETYKNLIKEKESIIHTLGILLENSNYKQSLKKGNLFELFSNVLLSNEKEKNNPLLSLKNEKNENQLGYEGINKNSALKVLDTFLSEPFSLNLNQPKQKQFIYISAADAFKPLIPSKYIETKREAEFEIIRKCELYNNKESLNKGNIKPILIRPGLMYHPHIRPLTTLPAFLIDISSKLSLKLGGKNPFASNSFFYGTLESFKTFPLHVDHVALSILKSIEDSRQGIIDKNNLGQARIIEVSEMRELAGLGKS